MSPAVRTMTARMKIDSAFETVSSGMVRLKRLAECRPLIRSLRMATSTASDVVLMPPPHEPGLAPTNMRMMRMKRVATAREPMSSVLKPAVRAVIDWKRDARICSLTESPAIWLSRSRTKTRSGARDDEDERHRQHDPGVEGQRDVRLRARKLRTRSIQLVDDRKTDAAEHDERADRRVEENAPPVVHEARRKEGDPGVAERGYGMEERPRRPPRRPTSPPATG